MSFLTKLFFLVSTATAVAVLPLPLDDLDRAIADHRITPTDAKFSLVHGSLRVETGHAPGWPGIKISAPQSHWDLSPYAAVEIRVKNDDDAPIDLISRIDNPGADGVHRCVNGAVHLLPGASGVLRAALRRTGDDSLGEWLFGMRGYPSGPGGPNTVNPTYITQILVFFNKPTANHVFEIEGLRAVDDYVPPTASTRDADPFFPFIDSFGQYRHKDWPGKIHSDAELATAREAEQRELQAQPAPPSWDRFGGWKTGPQFESTGFFRTQKSGAKWWLVDPDGRLFFSTGIDTIGASDFTPIADRENWFADFPGARPELADFLSPDTFVLQGHWAGQKVRAFSFGAANLRRKYGPDWRARSAETIHARLRSWGINTIGLWSDEKLRVMRKTPYVEGIVSTAAKPIAASEGHWGKFPDPFDPSFRETVQQSAMQAAHQSADDPWCLGYFSDNEMSWGDDTSLALATLQSPADQPAKRAFLTDLRSKYQDVGKLNSAWAANYHSWDDFLSSTAAPNYEKTRPDLVEFYTRIAEEYFRTVRDVLRAVAPKHLYLGCRFAWGNARAQAAAAKFCDVVSFNLYYHDPSIFVFEANADVPLLIGEFHFGALDRGMFHPGLVPVDSQRARAEAYKTYVTGALRDARFVGCHWFEYQDEPVTGRAWDEENFQIGFVDVADTPDAETVAAARAVAHTMYDTRSAP